MSKKKILLLSDDLRMHSGIATQSKEFVIGTLDTYDWVQIGGAVKHPEEGKIIDMGQAIEAEYGLKKNGKFVDNKGKPFEKEEDIFKFLGMKFIKPEDRKEVLDQIEAQIKKDTDPIGPPTDPDEIPFAKGGLANMLRL